MYIIGFWAYKHHNNNLKGEYLCCVSNNFVIIKAIDNRFQTYNCFKIYQRHKKNGDMVVNKY